MKRTLYFSIDDLALKIEAIGEAGSPGRVTGPPEDCYPPEPAVLDDIESIQAWNDEKGDWEDLRVEFLPPEEARILSAQILDRAQTAWEEADGEPTEGPFDDPPEDEDPFRGWLGSEDKP